MAYFEEKTLQELLHTFLDHRSKVS